MAVAKMRPTFTVDLPVSADEAIPRVRLVLAAPDLSESSIWVLDEAFPQGTSSGG